MKSHLNSQNYKREMKKYAFSELEGLEIGPQDQPIVSRNGYHIYYVDYKSQDELQMANENNPEIQVNHIENLDFVWKPGCRLQDCVNSKKFDYIVASQVMEHVPDVIGWLEQLQDVLVPGGGISIGLPDKRYTFDVLREETTTAEIIESFLREEKIPTIRQIYDNCVHAVQVDEGKMVDVSKEHKYYYTPQEALNFATYSYFHEEYVDVHCTVWTPESFQAVFHELNLLNLIFYNVEVVEIPDAGSFVAHLIKTEGNRFSYPHSREERLRKEIERLSSHEKIQDEKQGMIDKMKGLLPLMRGRD